MGYVDALKNYREIAGIRRRLKKRLLDLRPTSSSVSMPPISISGSKPTSRKAGIKTIHYVSPSIWAWRGGRIKKSPGPSTVCWRCSRWSRRCTRRPEFR
jgi:lipid-A-disaccharide synthase